MSGLRHIKTPVTWNTCQIRFVILTLLQTANTNFASAGEIKGALISDQWQNVLWLGFMLFITILLIAYSFKKKQVRDRINRKLEIASNEMKLTEMKQKTSELEKKHELLQVRMDRLQENKMNYFQKIAVPTAEGYELISCESVIMCEAEDNYTHLFLKNKRKLTACRTLKEMEELLSGFPYFSRVHHSFLVNLNEVVKYVRGEGGYLVMSDGAIVNVSRRRKDSLIRLFERSV